MSFDPQVQKLIDQGIITSEQAQAAADATPAANEVTGIARCLNRGCERYDAPRPVQLRKHTVYHRAPGLPLIESSSTHLVALDDADLMCPVETVAYTETQSVPFVDDEGVERVRSVTVERSKVVGCGGPCAIQEHEPPVYQKMLVV